MGIQKRHAVGGNFVHMRGSDLAAIRVQALHISIAKIVGEDENDIWIIRFDWFAGKRRCYEQRERTTENKGKHFHGESSTSLVSF